MYIPGFGSCSAILHLIAKHPKVILGLGLLTIASYLVSPLGPGTHYGADGVIQQQEQKIAKVMPDIDAREIDIAVQFATIEKQSIHDSSIQYVLDHICECKDIRIVDVRKSPRMLHDVSYLYFLDLCHAYGLERAKALYSQEHK
jgi:hypothetical protein